MRSKRQDYPDWCHHRKSIFEVNSALLSRCQVYTLNALSAEAIETLLTQAIQSDRFLQERHIQIEEFDALIQFAAGDARKALNLLDLVASTLNRIWKISSPTRWW